MRQFWDLAVSPVLDALRPQRILEIGIDQGLTTRRLAEFAASHGAVLEAIDPAPKIDVAAWQREFGPAFRCHVGLSLEVLPNLAPFDVALLDGDHNWYTVHSELQALETLAAGGSKGTPPLIILHDIGWPYARRDLYYDASTIPKWNRQPHQVGGLEPGRREVLDSGGFNAHLDHALFDEGERNGVLTAVEDFLSESELSWEVTRLPGLNGLGILSPTVVLEENGRLRDVLDSLGTPATLTGLVELVERERITSETNRQAALRDLAAARAEPVAAEPAQHATERIGDLEAQLAIAEQRVSELGQQLGTSATAEELEAMTAERASLSKRLSAAEKGRSKLSKELAATTKARAEIEGRLAAATFELDRLRERADEERAAARQATEEAREARVAADEAARGNELLERRHTALERRDQELEEELAAYRRRIREATEAREEAEYRLSLVERRLADHEREAAQQREVTEAGRRAEQELKEQLATRDTEIAELTTSRLRLAAEHADAMETMEQALADARWQADAAQTSARELRERLEVREVESDGLEEQIRQLTEALAAARIDAETARAHREAAEMRLAASAELPAPPPTAVAAPATPPAPEPAVPEPTAPAPPLAPVEPAEPPTKPDGSPLAELTFMSTELQAHESFRNEYAEGFEPVDPDDPVDPLARPQGMNFRDFLRAEHDPASAQPSADVVVCVHNALEDVRLCVWSILEKTDRPFRLVLVNDGSDVATTEYLEDLARREPAIHLVRNPEPPHGYTIAANLGVRAATGDYVVLLNSDTIVTQGWLDRIVASGEAEPSVGILGPLSNAASHQSVPDLRSGGAWSTNPLPPFASPDALAKLLERLSPQMRPRLPFINGFCYVIKRAVIDAIGHFDEENFASGYCEENDYSYRASQAGFELAVVDDAYVFHAKSKSFGVETRKVIAKRNYEIFLDKHGRDTIQALVKGMESETALNPLRARVSDALSSPSSLVSALDCEQREPLSIVFILPGLGLGGSGGSHSIYQEVHGMRQLGLDAKIALAARAFSRARTAYDDADDVFVPFADMDELKTVTAHADVISATHFKSVVMLAELSEQRNDFLPAYYVQDYEPFFTSRDNEDFEEAAASYTLVPECLLFAKTHWLCNIVAARHGTRVAKVEPSIDEGVYRPREAMIASGPVRIAAMVRPRTPRRQPSATVAVMEQVAREYGADVRITPFGCSMADLERLTHDERLLTRHRGLLSRTEVAELLWDSDVFLDMSMYQAFGRTALEAMACGATAVVPRLGGVWEFLEHDGNGLAVDAFDPRQAFDAVASLVADRDRLRRLQTAALETGSRYSILRAALSEYLLFAREHALRFGTTARA